MKPPTKLTGNWILNSVIAAFAAIMFWSLRGEGTALGGSPVLPWWLLAGLFGLAEVFLVHLHFRRENHSFSLSEIPLVLGLFFATPTSLILGQFVGAALALGIHRRQKPVKLVFNLAQMTLGAGIAATIFQSVVDPGQAMSPKGWAAAMFAAMIITVISSFWIALAIVFAAGQSLTDILQQSLGRAVVVTLCNTSIGLITAQTIGRDIRAFWLLIIPIAAMLLFYRIYRTERQERSELEFLSGLSSQLHASEELGQGLVSLLQSLREVLRSEIAEANVLLADPESYFLTRVGPNGEIHKMEESSFDANSSLVTSRERLFLPRGSAEAHAIELSRRGLKDALVAPIYNEMGYAGTLLLGNRAGDVDTYFHEDLRLLETTANLTGIWLQSAKLAEAVRGSEERFRSLVQNSSDVISVVSPSGAIFYQSPSVARILGYDPDELIDTSIFRLIHPEDSPNIEASIRESRTRPSDSFLRGCRIRHIDGTWRPCEVTFKNLLNDPAISGIVLNIRDISERKELEDQLWHQAFHDPLTGLPNRALFADRVDHALARSKRDEGKLAVSFLDLDDFKEVNDSLGHVAGDELLRTVAERLRSVLRPEDTSARLGGDEFGLLLEDIEPSEAELAVNRVLTKIRDPLNLQGREIIPRASAGIATNIVPGISVGELLRGADVAMYVAKKSKPGGYEVFQPAMDAVMLSRLELKADLEHAITGGQFLLQYQPILSLELQGIIGAEALLRWNHPTRGLIPPSEFIPLAEETGLIRPLGRWVLKTACEQTAEWKNDVIKNGFRMSVNLSATQLQHTEVVDEIQNALEESSVSPELLTLEITESTLVHDVSTTISRLNDIKTLGVQLAVDDFGTGYSSLSYLKKFPIDIIKIDRAFVQGVTGNIEDGALTQAIIRIADTLHLSTIAEGIETSEQLEALKLMGCSYGQGFYFAEPLGGREMGQLLEAATV